MKKNTKRKLIPAVAALSLASTAGAMAFLTTADQAESVNTITVGEFSLAITQDEHVINLLNTFPMSDEAAAGNDATLGSFTLKNTGTIEQKIRLQAENVTAVEGDDTFEIGHDKVRVIIMSGETELFNGTLDQFEGAHGKTYYPEIYRPNDSKEYTVRAYISDAAGNDDVYKDGKVGSISFQLGVYGVQANGGLANSTNEEWTAITFLS